jgi:hypothetical protein
MSGRGDWEIGDLILGEEEGGGLWILEICKENGDFLCVSPLK